MCPMTDHDIYDLRPRDTTAMQPAADSAKNRHRSVHHAEMATQISTLSPLRGQVDSRLCRIFSRHQLAGMASPNNITTPCDDDRDEVALRTANG